MNNASWEGGRKSSHSAAGIRPTDHGAVIDVSRPESTLYYAAAVTESRSPWQSIDDSSIWLLEGEKQRHMSLTENATYFFSNYFATYSAQVLQHVCCKYTVKIQPDSDCTGNM